MLLYSYNISFSIVYSLIVIKKRQFTIILFLSPRVQKLESWQRRPRKLQRAKEKPGRKPSCKSKFSPLRNSTDCVIPPPRDQPVHRTIPVSLSMLTSCHFGCYSGRSRGVISGCYLHSYQSRSRRSSIALSTARAPTVMVSGPIPTLSDQTLSRRIPMVNEAFWSRWIVMVTVHYPGGSWWIG